jgi:putative transposase
LDWATRRVLSWRLSITMEAAFCVETLEDALARHGRPEIFNTESNQAASNASQSHKPSRFHHTNSRPDVYDI